MCACGERGCIICATYIHITSFLEPVGCIIWFVSFQFASLVELKSQFINILLYMASFLLPIHIMLCCPGTRYETSAHLWLVLEYCVGGDLMTLLRQVVVVLTMIATYFCALIIITEFCSSQLFLQYSFRPKFFASESCILESDFFSFLIALLTYKNINCG